MKLKRQDKTLIFIRKKIFGVLKYNIGNILNLSSKILTTIEMNVLKLGLKFFSSIKYISQEVVFSNFESV